MTTKAKTAKRRRRAKKTLKAEALVPALACLSHLMQELALTMPSEAKAKAEAFVREVEAIANV